MLGVNSIEPGFPFSSPGQLESTPRVNAHVIIFSVPPFRLALSAGGGYTERTMPSLSLPALSRRAFTATVLPEWRNHKVAVASILRGIRLSAPAYSYRRASTGAMRVAARAG